MTFKLFNCAISGTISGRACTKLVDPMPKSDDSTSHELCANWVRDTLPANNPSPGNMVCGAAP
jgi:hypothetical protein